MKRQRKASRQQCLDRHCSRSRPIVVWFQGFKLVSRFFVPLQPHYLHGGYYPVGGASRIAETIIPVIQRSGGDVLTYADVAEIMTKDDKGRQATGVRMGDGTILTAPIVISNAGVINTFEKLLPETAREHMNYAAKRKTITPSMSHLGMYISLKGTAEALGLPRTNFWIYPDGDYSAAVEAFTKDPSLPFPVVYISFPSAKDPDYQRRYPGRSALEIVAPTIWDQFAQWKDTNKGIMADWPRLTELRCGGCSHIRHHERWRCTGIALGQHAQADVRQACEACCHQ